MKKLFLFAIIASLLWSVNAIGQIAQRGSATTDNTISSGVLTINKPSGVIEGDVLFANIIQSRSSDGTLPNEVTSDGWTVISGSNLGSGNTDRVRGTILYKIAGGSEPTNYDFALNNANSNSAAGVVVAFSGVDITGGVLHTGSGTGPFDVAAGTHSVGNSNAISCSAISTSTANAAIIMFAHNRDNSGLSSWNTTNPGVLTEIGEIQNSGSDGSTAGIAFEIKSATGSTGNGTASIASSERWGAMLVALKPIPPAPPTPIGCNGQFFVSHGSSGTSGATTTMDKLTFSSGTITATPFSTDPTGIGYNAIGINPIDGFMYGVRYAPLRLIMVGATTPGNVIDLGAITGANINGSENGYAGCFDADGTFYFITDDNQFYKITGINYPAAPLAATNISSVSPASGFYVDIAIDPTDGQMYGVAGTGASNKNLYKINKTTGAQTLVGTYSGGNYIAALFFDEVGGLYGYRQDGTFQQINKTNAAQVQVGTAPSYTYADGCSCSFGRVFHDLDFTANPGNQICPSLGNPNPSFPLVVSVTNQSNAQQTGLTYTLNISDPAKRFRFTESAATIKTNLIAAGVATVASTVTLSTEAPATGTNYNKVVVTGFQTGIPTQTLAFTLQVQLYTLGGGLYLPVPLQSEITGLPAIIGSSDLSNDPGTIDPDDPTTIIFCPNITLPVQLISFTAKRNNTLVNLKWSTSMELNNSGFQIERKIGSSDNWETIGFVATQAQGGNSNDLLQYSYNDLNAAKAITQYRLRQVDFDANATYSVIRSVRGEGQLGKTIVYPNPSNNGKINVVFEDAAVTREISVSDMSGRLVRQIRGISNNNITIENLNPGMYMIRIVAVETGEQVVEKVIVNKR